MAYPFRRALALLLASALLLTLPACGSSQSGSLVVRYDLTAQPRSLDPQLSTSNESLLVLENVFEGLLRQSPDGPVPGVAERYTVSADGLTYTFTLRENMEWSDGKTPLTAEDFVFAFRRVVDPATASPAVSGFLCIQNARQIQDGLMPVDALAVTAPDARTFVVQLTAPNPFFPEIAASAAAMPCNEAFFIEARGRYGYSDEYLLTNGPLRISRTVQDKRMELRVNAQYHTPSATRVGGVNLYYQADDEPDPDQPDKELQTAEEKVRQRFLEEKTDAIAATPAEAEQYLAAMPEAQSTSFQNRVWGLTFNCADAAYGNAKLRGALALALDTSSFAPYLTGSLAPADAIVPAAVTLLGLPYRETVGGGLAPTPDAVRAKALYDEALAELSLTKAPRTAILCPDTDDFAVMLGAYQRQLQQTFGIYVNLEPLPEHELLTRVLSGDYTLAFVPLTAERSSPDSVLDRFAGYSSRSVAGYASPAYDALLTRAQEASDPPSAAALFLEAERMLVQEAVFVPIAFQTTYYVSAPGITGLEFSPFSHHVFFQRAEEIKKK